MTIDELLREAWTKVPAPDAAQRANTRASLERLVAGRPEQSHPRRRVRTVWRVGTTAAGLAVIAGLLLAALPRGTEDPPSGTTPATAFPTVSLFTEPPSKQDLAQTRSPGAVAPDLVDTSTLRFAGSVDGTRYFAASGTSDDVVCVLSSLTTVGSSNVCSPPGALARYGQVVSISPPRTPADPRRTIVGLVPDGIDQVQIGNATVAVSRNVFALQTTALRPTVTLIGPSAPLVGISVGMSWPRSQDANGTPTVTVPIVPEGVIIPGIQTTPEPPNGVLIGNRLVSVTAVPSEAELTPGRTTTVPATNSLKWRVAVLNGGDTVMVNVTVKATYRQPAMASTTPVTTSATIPRIDPGATVTTDIAGPPQDSFAIGSTGVLHVSIDPMPGERNIGNNAVDLPVKIDFG